MLKHNSQSVGINSKIIGIVAWKGLSWLEQEERGKEDGGGKSYEILGWGYISLASLHALNSGT